MDRDLALQLIEVLEDIKADLDDIVTNTTPADGGGGDDTPPADGGGGDAVG